MDDTKKALLSIDIDTTALTKNLSDAKSAVTDLTAQLNALKVAGQANTPVFADISKQLKTTTTDYNNATKALKAYTDALTQKNKTEQDAVKTPAAAPATPAANAGKTGGQTSSPDANKPIDPNAPVLQANQTNSIQSDGLTSNAAIPSKDFAAENDAANKKAAADAQKQKQDAETQAKKDAQDAAQKARDAARNTAAATALQDKATANIKNNFKEEIAALQTRDTAYADSANTIAAVFGSNTEAGKAALVAKKAFGAAEIAMNTETQISTIITGTANAVTNDLKIPIIGEALAAVDIAGGVVRVAAAIASGAQQISKLNSITVPNATATTTTAKGKARGGVFISDGYGAYLTGPGSGTSDSINARLSNGESVINARSTQMFAPILSAINQAGGGVAFHTTGTSGAYATGGLFNGSNTLNDASNELANTRATNNMIKTITANMPRQVLVVEDVQASLQNKVMLQNMSNF